MVGVTEKKQFNSRVDAEKVEQVRGLDMSNTEVMDKALDMFLRAHGMMDEESIKREINDIDREIQRIRREANQEIADLVEDREELVETLEWRQRQQDHVEMTIQEIAEGLNQNPNQNLLAYQEQVEFLIAHNDGPYDLEEVVEQVREYGRENDIYLGVKQLVPDAWNETMGAGGAVSADGTGDADEDAASVDYDGFNYGGDDGGE